MSAVRKKTVNQVCPHCMNKIKWTWVIRYESVGFVRLVYLCNHCEQVIKTESEKANASLASPPAPLIMSLV